MKFLLVTFLAVSTVVINFALAKGHKQIDYQPNFVDKQDTIFLPPIGESWGNNGNKDLSLPSLLLINHQLIIKTDKQLDNVYVGVTDQRNMLMYSEVTNIPTNYDYIIDLSILNSGSYYVSLIKGANYLMYSFEIE